MWLLKDMYFVVVLVVMAVVFVINAIGVGLNIQEIRHNIAIWGLTWFELLVFILGIAFLLVVIQLRIRLRRFEKAKPLLNTSLISFPISGTRIVKSDKLFAPETGYAKIAVRNIGGLLGNCIGTVKEIAKVTVLKGELHITPLVFTSTSLFWDNGNMSMNIPNDGVERYLNLAYLDQNNPDAWQLAIDKSKREDYFTGWHKIDVVISSLESKVEPLKVEVALGFAGREDPPPPLNLWPWDVWHKAVLKRMQQEPHKEDFQLE